MNGAAIKAYRSVVLGNRVQVGAASLITDTDLHSLDPQLRKKQILGLPYPFQSVVKEAVIIEDDVWIGYNVIILKGVRISRGSIVGAGSIVTSDVPPLVVVGGNPARILKALNVYHNRFGPGWAYSGRS